MVAVVRGNQDLICQHVQLENAQEMLRVAEQNFATTIETFEEKLVEVQRKTREEVKEEFDGKIMEMQRVQAQLQ